MKCLLVYFCLVATFFVKTECHQDLEIINGNIADINDFPYTVAILKNNSHICGGSVIHSKFILTTAGCIVTNNATLDDLSVRAGSSYYASGGQQVDVVTINLNPNYTDPEYNDDIAVLELSSPLNLDESVQIVPLATDPKALDMDQSGNITGWGIVNRADIARHYRPSEQLRYTTQPVVEKDSCDSEYSVGWNEDSMFCAGMFMKDSCVGDSGNPFVVNGTQYGMVSIFTLMCGEIPIGYVNVAYYKDFIDGIVKNK